MPDILIDPSCLCGEISAPPSKSAAHRALICASLADSTSTLSPLRTSQDILATMRVMSAIGAQISLEDTTAFVRGGVWKSGASVLLNCGESGSTLRFLLPVAAALGLNARFLGEGKLPSRPISVLAAQLRMHGVSFSEDQIPFTIDGQLTGGRFELPGDISSQFVSGLLFALPLLDSDSEIVLTSPLQSASYVDLTLAALAQFGISIALTPLGYKIHGRQRYHAANVMIESDYSNAAFWLCAGAIGGSISVRNLRTDSLQGDRAIMDIIARFGGQITIREGLVSSKKSALTGCRIDAAPIPDLVPIIAVMAAFARGNTEIYNASRLRIKESDRLTSTTALLRALGGEVEEFEDRLIVHGGGLSGGVVDGANDHRIVMSAAIAAAFCERPVSITGVQAVAKSYPDFFEAYQKLGGRFHVKLG